MLDPGKKQHFPTTYNTNYRSSKEFGAERKLISDDDSGICSPPLWGTISPPRSPQHHYRILSPTSRAQAIARGQKELMEMVSKMPEGCYELSLRDIVEHSATFASDPAKGDGSFAEDSFTDETNIMKIQKEKKKKQVQRQMSRSGSMDHNHNGGFLLKMVFPVSFGSSKKKKKTMMTTKTKAKNNNDNNISNSNSGSGRVSPRPLLVDRSVKSGENEWWKNRFVEAEESESGGLSSNSGSSKSTGSSASTNSSGRNNNNASSHGGGGCWAFIFWKRTKKAKKKMEGYL